MNVDSLHIEAQPVKVTGRKSKGLPGLKKEEQQKLTTILLGVIGGGMVIALIVFIWAFHSGLLSSKKIETKKEATKTEEPNLEKTAAGKEAKAADKADDDKDWTAIPKEFESAGPCSSRSKELCAVPRRTARKPPTRKCSRSR